MPYKLSAEVVDDEYPVLADHRPGRVASTCRAPRPAASPRSSPSTPSRCARCTRKLAEPLGVADGDLVTVTSRRGTITLPAHVVNTIRPDTVFIPYHWPGDKAANQLTNRAVDPLSKMPEFKVAAVRVERAGGHADTTDARDLELHGRRPMSSRPVRHRRQPVFVIDQSRCIGCEACVQACAECGTHRGQSLIHLERVDRAASTQTAPMVCMHCEDPTCAQVCPADAIKQTEDGIVQSALKPRCIGCSNCVLACPFGVPKYVADFDQMMKCDMCTDRTSEGLTPMCASVCPSEALWYGTIERVPRHPHAGRCSDDFMFGRQEVRTKVYTVIDDALGGPLDVARRARNAPGSTTRSDSSSRGAPDDRAADTRRRPGRPPPWKRDFPYQAVSEEEVTRREFARYLVLGAGTIAVANVGLAAVDPTAHASTPANRGRSSPLARRRCGRAPTCSAIPSDDDPAILVRLSDTEVVAFSQKCTHLGCVVYYEPDEQRWHCPCHEGNFEARTGDVISGPPTRRSAASTSRSATTA